MPRIRTLKPSIWTDNRFIELTRDARLLLIGMISHADDEGRLVASGPALIGTIYPHDNVTVRAVEKWRDEVADCGLVTVYQHGRGTYAAFPGWRKHQYIQRPSPSTLPAPDQAEHQPRSGRDAGPRSQTDSVSRYRSDSVSRSQAEEEREEEEEEDVDVDAPLTRTGTRHRPIRVVS